jgi:hypothetical protein
MNLESTIHGLPDMTNEQDGIYTGASTDHLVQSNTGKHMMPDLTKERQSYIGSFNIVLNSVNLMMSISCILGT